MKIIEQSHHFIHESDPMKLIELAGRTCYKSEDKITDDSAKRFVRMITKAGHYSVLEHVNACFEIESKTTEYLTNSEHTKYLYWSLENNRILVSGNFRAWLEFFQRECFTHLPNQLQLIHDYLNFNFPKIFPVPITYNIPGVVKRVHEEQMTTKEKLIHATRSCRFITNRGVTHEMVRHRNFSYSQESTRYVKYDGNMEFILPVWFDPIWTGDWSDRKSAWQSRFGRRDEDWMAAPAIWLWACEQAELYYQSLISTHNQRPEQARGVLPNDLKTEIVCTAPLAEWKHILNLRTSKAAHPQIRHLLIPVLEELQKELPEIFLS